MKIYSTTGVSPLSVTKCSIRVVYICGLCRWLIGLGGKGLLVVSLRFDHLKVLHLPRRFSQFCVNVLV